MKKICKFCKINFLPNRKKQIFCSPICFGRDYSKKHNSINVIVKRFWVNVKKTNKCWEWQLGKDKNGYGIFTIKGHSYKAHRISYQIINGKIPEKMCILHKCDNPLCVRPDHLFLGTLADNSIDMVMKGRSLFGEKNRKSKLKDSDILKIRSIYNKNKITQTEIANIFNVTQSMIGFIVRKENWIHI